MFKPNSRCRIELSSGKSTVYGQPQPGLYVNEACTVVKIIISNVKSSVRADSSASRGNALELQADSVILLTVFTKAKIDDIIEIAGAKLRIMGMQPRFDAAGRLDHYQAHCGVWSNG